MFVAVIVRRLRPGMTRDDFVRAWYPDKGFGVPGQGALGPAMERLAEQEAVRHDRIARVVESTSLRGMFEVHAEFDFATDESVERGRPAPEGA